MNIGISREEVGVVCKCEGPSSFSYHTFVCIHCSMTDNFS